jgi:hypothetical protein
MDIAGRARFVTHRLIDDDDIGRAADAVRRSRTIESRSVEPPV